MNTIADVLIAVFAVVLLYLVMPWRDRREQIPAEPFQWCRDYQAMTLNSRKQRCPPAIYVKTEEQARSYGGLVTVCWTTGFYVGMMDTVGSMDGSPIVFCRTP